MSRTKAKRPRIPQKTSNRQLLSMVMTIALPVALQNVLTTTGSMVDTMMLGTIGQNTVGAVGLCAQFSSLLFSGFWGFVGGGMLFFAQYWGAGNDEGILRSYGIMLAFMAIPATVFSSLALGAPYFVMRIYTSSVPIQEIGVRYLRVVGFSYPLMVLATAMSALLRSTERVKIPLPGARRRGRRHWNRHRQRRECACHRRAVHPAAGALCAENHTALALEPGASRRVSAEKRADHRQ